jgi:hypothetical protein
MCCAPSPIFKYKIFSLGVKIFPKSVVLGSNWSPSWQTGPEFDTVQAYFSVYISSPCCDEDSLKTARRQRDASATPARRQRDASATPARRQRDASALNRLLNSDGSVLNFEAYEGSWPEIWVIFAHRSLPKVFPLGVKAKERAIVYPVPGNSPIDVSLNNVSPKSA